MRLLLRWVVVLLCASGAPSTPALALAQAQAVQVMVLGTYHFANPGLDIHNAKVDDVLAPQRQREITQLLDNLARFRPTRIAVEMRADSEAAQALPAYREFLSGSQPTSRNEIDQIAFRLGRQLGHADVFGIDVEGEFPFEAVQQYAQKSGRAAELQSALDTIGQRVKAFEARQRQASIGQLLREMNTRSAIQRDYAFYAGMLAWGSGAAQPGAALVASWTTRNLGICARLVQLAKPGDRVLVVYGAGHAFALRDCVQQMPGWQLVEPGPFLPR
jgi:Family of unknown function (DUF5694)